MNDREMLLELMERFDFEVHYCDCGRSDPTSDCDSANFLREYLAAHPTDTQPAPGAFDALIKKLTETADWAENTNPHLRNRTAELLREAAAALASHKPQPAADLQSRIAAAIEADPETKGASLEECNAATRKLEQDVNRLNAAIGLQPAAPVGVDEMLDNVRQAIDLMRQSSFLAAEKVLVSALDDYASARPAASGGVDDCDILTGLRKQEALYQKRIDANAPNVFGAGKWFELHELMQGARLEIERLRALSTQPAASGVDEREAFEAWPKGWRTEGFNYCFPTAIKALRYLANNARPIGGEQDYNAIHLLQLADELKRTQDKFLSRKSPQPTSPTGDVVEAGWVTDGRLPEPERDVLCEVFAGAHPYRIYRHSPYTPGDVNDYKPWISRDRNRPYTHFIKAWRYIENLEPIADLLDAVRQDAKFVFVDQCDRSKEAIDYVINSLLARLTPTPTKD